MDSTNERSMRLIPSMPGCRISATATRITTTRTTTIGRGLSADQSVAEHADFSCEELVVAYIDCRHSKRNTFSALEFEQNQERNLWQLKEELADCTYKPGPSVCFVVKRPKPREVWAAEFRDRIVHHLLFNRVSGRFHASFIVDSCACIKGRGTLYAAKRLEAKIRSATQNWSRPARYLKCDIANFFVSIDKRVLHDQLAAKITEPWWLWLTDTILFHDPRENVQIHSSSQDMALIPEHKRLFNQPAHLGLPIGNLSSQFFANVTLDPLDQFIKHELRCRHYIRYVDDFVLLHESKQQLDEWLAAIADFLPRELRIWLNPRKTIQQPVARGVDFVGQVIKPWRRSTRRRTVDAALRRIRGLDADELFESANSYLGLFSQASHSHADRARMANLLRHRGYTINQQITKTYRRRT